MFHVKHFNKIAGLSAQRGESEKKTMNEVMTINTTATAEARGDEELTNAITSITDFLNHASREEVLEVKEYIEEHYNND